MFVHPSSCQIHCQFVLKWVGFVPTPSRLYTTPLLVRRQGRYRFGYTRVRHIIKNLDPPLVMLAYRVEFDLLYRREATHANAM